MTRAFRSFLFLLPLFAFSFAGCTGGDDVPADAPKAPEPGSAEYDSYSSGSRTGPGGGHGAGGGGGHGATEAKE